MNLIIVIVVVGLAALLVGGIYNQLVRRRNEVDNAWSQIDVQLKRRLDLIPNLVETVKGYAAHEKTALEAVVSARNSAMCCRIPKAVSLTHASSTVMQSKRTTRLSRSFPLFSLLRYLSLLNANFSQPKKQHAAFQKLSFRINP